MNETTKQRKLMHSCKAIAAVTRDYLTPEACRILEASAKLSEFCSEHPSVLSTHASQLKNTLQAIVRAHVAILGNGMRSL